MTQRTLPLIALPLVLAACEVPVVPIECPEDSPGCIGETPAVTTYVEGKVLVQDGVSSSPRGPAVVFRFPCDNPPPPAGRGSPVDVVVVPEDAFFSGEAAFVFPQVPGESCVLLTGYIDRDRDFDLLVSIGAQPTRGDLAMTPVVLQTQAADEDGDVPPTTGVEIRANITVPFDKPGFVATSQPPNEDPTVIHEMVLPLDAGTPIPNAFAELQATELASPVQDVEDPVFTMVFAPDLVNNNTGEEGPDGRPDDLTGTGQPDFLWPIVIFQKLDDRDPTGGTVDTENPVIIPGPPLPIDPNDIFNGDKNIELQWNLQGLPFDGVTMELRDWFVFAIPPLVLVDRTTRETMPIRDFAAATGTDVAGRYQMLVMNNTGQIWTVPNELASYQQPGQGSTLVVRWEEEGE